MPNLKNQEEVKSLVGKFKSMKGMILTEYHGLSVEDISELRSKLRPLNSEYAIVKNTLGVIALKEAGIDAGDNFSGPTALVIENGDAISPAKIVVDFAKDHAKLKIRAAFFEGKFVDAAFVQKLSSIPSKEILLAKMLGSMNSPIASFARVLDAISKKQAA